MSSEAPKPEQPEKPKIGPVPHLWRSELSGRVSPVVSAGEPDSRTISRKRKVFRVLCVMLGLAGVIVGLLSWLRPLPQPAFFPIWVASYQSFLLPLPNQSSRDRNAFREGQYFYRTNPDAYINQELTFLNNELTGLEKLTGSQTVVVYLSAFASGSTSTEGGKTTTQVLVFPGDVLPDQPSSKLPLKRVLEALRDCSVRRKLLILDIMRPLAQLGEPGVPPGRLGLLADDVASRMDMELEAVPDPNRLVLLACSPGQYSLSSEVMGRSILSYYLEAGLLGSADGWGPAASRWGRIEVLELAYYVRDRVDQWAWRNRRLRQTPLLRGTGSDFQLVGLEHGEPEPPPVLREPQTYPQWLFEDFRRLDQWRADGSYRIRPRTFRQLEAIALREEQNWRGGQDSGKVENLRQPYIDNLVKQYAEARQAILNPDPRSLALAVAQGRKPDPKLVETIQALVEQVKTQTLGLPPDKAQPVVAKLTDDFWKKQKDVDLFSLSYAVFEAALNESRPTPELLRFLDGLLLAKAPAPLYVETLCLNRLAQVSLTGGEWPLETVRRVLAVTALGERAGSHFRSIVWLQPILDAADQARFHAEYLFWARGYAPMDEADRLLRQAQDQYGQVLAMQDNLLTALRTRDEAFATLLAYVSYLDRAPQDEKAWFLAVQAAIDLEELVKPLAGGPPPLDQIRIRSDAWRVKADVLRGYLDQLGRPLAADGQARLIKGTKQPETQAAVSVEIDAVLTTSLLSAEDRVALWKADIALARQLVDDSLRADAEPTKLALNPLLPDLDRQHLEREQRQRADLRSRMAIALLRLGGLAAADLKTLEDARAAFLQKGDMASLDALGVAVQKAWAERLPARLATETDPYVRNRLGWIVPPFDSNRILDEAATNPTLVLETTQSRALWGWLAATYRLRSRDMPGSGFYTEVARQYQALTNQPATTQPGIQITTTSPLPRLTPTQPTGSLAIQVSRTGTMSADKISVDLNVISPANDWLQITPEIEGAAQKPQGPWTITLDGSTPRTIWLRLALQPGAESAGLGAMQGFIVTAKTGDRIDHQKITLAVLPLGNRPEIILTANPNNPAPPIGSVRLRTVKTPQPIFVYVRNPTDKPYTINGDILASDGSLLGSAAKVPLTAREVRRITFSAPPVAVPVPPAGTPMPPPGSPGLPELKGPLQIRLVDAANPNTVFDVRQVEVEIALPREYVQVGSIVFQPTDFDQNKPNQLQAKLRATAALPGPPCLIELVLPPTRIPGFLGAKEGTFRGELPPPGQDLSLFARNLVFNEGSPREGTIYFNVDGYERAFLFRTNFLRSGDAVSPQQDYRPALRLKAERYAQANSKYEVTLEVDNAPTGSTLELALGLNPGGVFQAEVTRNFPQARNRRIGFKPDGPGGSILFDAAINDWTVPLDASLIVGPRVLRARLLDSSGAEIQVVTQDVTLVSSAPTNVQILQAPKQAVRGTQVPIQAMGFDSQSGIQQVQFFFGKPIDGQLPPKTATIPATPTADDPNIYAAQVMIPETAAGPTDISVQFTNKGGLSSFATTTVQVVDKLAPQTGKIVGRLVEGPRPQPGLEVILSDPSAKDPKEVVIMKAKTEADGSFTFDNVKPGSYVLSATKEVANRKAEAKVTVKPGETVKVTLELAL